MLCYLVQPIRKTAFAAPPFYLFKAILQFRRHRFGFGFAGQGRQIGCQFFGFAVSNVQGHVSLRIDIFIHCYTLRQMSCLWQAL